MYLTIQGGRLFVRTAGEGAPLLLIHGVGSDAEYYQAASGFLADSFKVITYDRPGYSRSVPGRDGNTVAGQAAQTLALLEALAPEGAFVAACSAGCLIACELAARAPEKVRGLLLYEPPVSCDPEIRQELEDFTGRLREMNEKRQAARSLLTFIEISGGYDSESRSVSLDQQRQDYINYQHFLDEEMDGIFGYPAECLAQLQVPCTIAVGEKDPEGLFHRCGVSLAAQTGMPLVTACGYHNFPNDRPEAFAKLVKDVFS
jgi:pimeloyl-ACP methyl ester carboxylesterase